MSRELAAAKALADEMQFSPDVAREAAFQGLSAADAHDAAHGVHRLSLDDATVERAATALPHDPECFLRPSDGKCPCSHLRLATARAVLSASTKELP